MSKTNKITDIIKATELRIGNWFTDCDGERFWVAKDIELNENGYWVGIDHNDCINIEGCYPIPLTPEIFKKFDYKLSHNGYEEKFSKTGRLDISVGHSYITTVDYVHQYQNLFFSLLGTETEIIL